MQQEFLFDSFPSKGHAYHGLIQILNQTFQIAMSWENNETSLYVDENLKDLLSGHELDLKKVSFDVEENLSLIHTRQWNIVLNRKLLFKH